MIVAAAVLDPCFMSMILDTPEDEYPEDDDEEFDEEEHEDGND